MYTVMKDSLFEPKKILNFRNKSLFFVFAYLILLAILMSLGTIVYYAGYSENSTISSEITGCTIGGSNLTCDLATHDGTQEFIMYGVSMFFLNPDETVDSISTLSSQYMIIQGSTLSVYSNQKLYFSGSIAPVLETSTSFDSFISSFQTIFLIGFILVGIFSNIVIMIVFVLVSTIPFISLVKFIKFKKIFTLATFASTPVAFVMTFYSLLGLPDIVFLILLFISYRSLFVLRRELAYQLFLNTASQGTPPSNPDEEIKPEDRKDDEIQDVQEEEEED